MLCIGTHSTLRMVVSITCQTNNSKQRSHLKYNTGMYIKKTSKFYLIWTHVNIEIL